MGTRRLGVIARADDGGLGNQTRELVEHLQPEISLVVLMGESARGSEQPSRFHGHEVVFNHGPKLFDEVMADVLARCDVLYTIEGPYHLDLFEWCDRAGTELVIHANPELYRNWPCHRLLIPTSWREDRLPATAELLPFPINTERVRPAGRSEIPSLVHLTGPAMLDRQGTSLVLDALPFVQHECHLWIRREEPAAGPERYGSVTVEWVPPAVDYWDALPPGCWALLQPRRYGGLSLCIQEAAARGMFTISLDRDPEASFYRDLTRRAVLTDEQPYPMAGGQIGVAETDPRILAAAIDQFIDQPGDPAEPLAWAEAHSWHALKARYEEELR
jgi:hypothetical protein